MGKKILIVSHAMEIGGAERSLLGLLSALDPTKVDIDLFLLRHEGEFYEYIPSYVNVLPEVSSYTVLARPMKKTLREGHFLLTAARLMGKVMAWGYDRCKHYQNSAVALEYSHKYTWRLMPQIMPERNYDLAISFLTPHYIVANRVKAKKKIAWIHTDYSEIQINESSEYKMWNCYDNIISISEAVTKSFTRTFPQMVNKVLMIENILPKEFILSQANALDVQNEMPQDGNWRFLSIGRYCYAKNFDNVPEICYRLIQAGINVSWYIIGFGSDEELIKSKIMQWNMEEHVILLGKKENPYPYIKSCDWYIQPSRFEGKAVAVCEAQILHKPVIIANYATAKSQLVNGYDGMIVSQDNVECAKEIANIIKDEKLKESLIDNTCRKDYSNKKQIQKLYALIEGGSVRCQ